MSNIPQNHTNEKAPIDCVQEFFQNIRLVNFLPDAME